VVREQSDAYVVRDFFESEYRANPQPKSFLEIDQHWSNFSLDLSFIASRSKRNMHYLHRQFAHIYIVLYFILGD